MHYSYVPPIMPTQFDLSLQTQGWIHTNLAQQNGSLEKPALCVECNARPPKDFHHTNYDNPEEGDWLCRSCHRKEHARLKRIATYCM